MSAPLDIVVLASGHGSNLRAIADAIERGACAARIAGVVSDRADAAALAFAAERGVPTRTVPLAKGASRDAWNVALAEAVASLGGDLVVLAGFMRIVGAPFLAVRPGRVVNVHPSLLPAFPGKDAPAQALAAGVKVSGCTVHVVDADVDAGPILAQGVVPVLEGDDDAALHARIRGMEHRLLPAVIDAIGRGRLTLDPPRWHAPADLPPAGIAWPVRLEAFPP